MAYYTWTPGRKIPNQVIQVNKYEGETWGAKREGVRTVYGLVDTNDCIKLAKAFLFSLEILYNMPEDEFQLFCMRCTLEK